MQNLSQGVPTSLQIELRGYHLPSKKNFHFPGKNGRVLIDKPIKLRIEKIERDIVSQLLSLCQTDGVVMPMECWPPCLIALLTQSPPFDDHWESIPEIHINSLICEKGKEGVRIEIKELKNPND